MATKVTLGEICRSLNFASNIFNESIGEAERVADSEAEHKILSRSDGSN